MPKEALAIIYTEDYESNGGTDSYKDARVHWIDEDTESKLPDGKAIVQRFIHQHK